MVDKPKKKRHLRLILGGESRMSKEEWERKSKGLKNLRKSIQDGTFQRKKKN